MNKILLTLFLLTSISYAQTEWKLSSPDKAIALTVRHEKGSVEYAVTNNEAKILSPSRLGVLLWNLGDHSRDLVVLSVKETSKNKLWKQVWGQHEWVRDHYQGMVLSLKQKTTGLLMDIEFRVFNDGVAFRYLWPQQSIGSFDIQDELTEFKFEADDQVWWIPAFMDNRYEYLYRKTPVKEVNVFHTPATFELRNGHTVAIHEARLLDFASMALKHHGDGLVKADLVPWSDGVDVKVKLPHSTPWRTLIIADRQEKLVESTMVLNLNDPSVISDPSWIKTGKYIGIWWEMHLGLSTWETGPKHGANTANMKKYIDFAAEHGLNGVLVEGWNQGWNGPWWEDGNPFRFSEPAADFDLPYLAAYSKKKGVGIFSHHETGAAISNYERQMEEAYSYLEAHDIHAVKTGYVGPRMDFKEWHHGQYGVRHYTKAMQTGARHKVMLMVHEPIKPTGLERTYPNLMASEGARGQEYDAWADDGGNPPEHTTILPMTRLLAGPMDFTPGTFDLFGWRPHNRVSTTLAKQLALYVVIYSPWQMLSDLPENYLKHPEAFELLKRIPTDWEKTVGLRAKIGDYTVIARKEKGKGQRWYVGAITDENGRTLKINLDFLDSKGRYKVKAYQDSREASWTSNPYGMEIYETWVSREGSFDLHLAPGGGLLLEFEKL